MGDILMATGSNCVVIFTEPGRMSPHYDLKRNNGTVYLLAIKVTTERATNGMSNKLMS